MNRAARERALSGAAALLVFGAALASQSAPLWGRDPRAFVLVGRTASEQASRPRQAGYDFTPSDRRFSVSLVAQNARAFVSRPLRLFEAEPCHPARHALALGHPGLALGLLGAPAWLVTRDPIASYNTAVGLLRLLAALAMFLLVVDWTGVPAAGIAAGLLYAFHLPSADALTYPFIFDTSWAVFALFFARRFFAAGRWRDAIALALCCGLQLVESFYALLASLLLALPLGAWLGLRHRRGLRLAPALGAALLLALLAVAAFGPFLARGDPTEQSVQFFASAASLRPGQIASWLAALLAAAGLLLRPRPGGVGDPRLALLAGALLVALVATGGNETARLAALARGEPPPPALPNLYALLSAHLPGLDAVRAPGYALVGVGLALCVLAGLGAAALLRRLPARLAPLAGLLLVAAAFADVQRPHPLGLAAEVPLEAVRIRPAEHELAFFAALEQAGNRGPLFELPLSLQVGAGGPGSAISQVLLASYHGRRTSGCYNSILPPETRALAGLAAELPAPEALAALREQGFTTLVVHRAQARGLAPLLDAAGLRRLHEGRGLAAWEIPGSAGPRAR